MIGNNVMKLNQATVMAALQHYFDTVLFAEGRSPHVTSIVGGIHAPQDGFEVFVDDSRPEKQP